MGDPKNISKVARAILAVAKPDQLTPYDQRFLKDMTRSRMQAITLRQNNYLRALAKLVGYEVTVYMPLSRRQVNGEKTPLLPYWAGTCR